MSNPNNSNEEAGNQPSGRCIPAVILPQAQQRLRPPSPFCGALLITAPFLPPGILAKGLDPVGSGLGKVLSPVGAVVGTVTQPVTGIVGGVTKPVLDPVTGEKQERSQILGGDKRAEDFGSQKDKEKFGGKEQTGQNPLGL
ncbi:hypothetical protein MPH_04797 [Macrophomina phaseolina MS6]|uniref:Uncharacterized protein n=1 Tax=Macrophomina phaseolina (strain MS6) TaxID=1126212 RepID=K2SMF5_MACPH|nr:hypothetical protein MPH_04797 [Macrophomina phaseolina MS6]